MRLSSMQIFQQGISAILDQQSKVHKTELQIATGKRVLTPSDDPVAAVQILNINKGLALVDQYQRNVNFAGGQLALEETVLVDVGNLLHRVRELVIQANNASQSSETRKSIAIEIESRLDELLSLANTRDASGEYIFAGYQSQNEPFSQQGSVFSFNGDNGQRLLQVGSSTQVAVRDSGVDVFLSAPAGNGTFSIEPDSTNTGTLVAGSNSVIGSFLPDNYRIIFSQPGPLDPVSYQVVDSAAAVVGSGNYVPGETISFAGASIRFDGTPANGDGFQVSASVKQNLFSTLQTIVDDLNGSGSTAAENSALNNAMAQALDNLDQALGSVLAVRADVGVRLNHVENQSNLNESFTLQLQETLSGLQDLDFAEAISRLNLQLTALQAAQQVYVRVQGLSLFNFL